MSEPGELLIHTDGAARGNPGPAAFAYVIEREGGPAIEEKGFLGTKTNNVAEYTALVKALEHAARLGGRRLELRTDSDLMVNQIKGLYKVKNEGLRPYHEHARRLLREFESWEIRHIPRADNSRADRLCNEALDSAQGKSSAPAARSGARTVQANDARVEAVRAEAIDCLRAVAAAWARGNPQDPKPEQVWDQLWTILEDGGIVRAGGRTGP
jgi:ribonuclease HI